MIPQKLKEGDEIRIVAPARSLSMDWIQAVKDYSYEKLTDMGFRVTYGKHIEEKDEFNSSSIQSRVDDLHDAFNDKNVKAILTVIGGYNSNQLLSSLDYPLIKNNPKILCGYSDITALGNGIYAKTGMITYSGPHFFNFGDKKGIDYTEKYFRKCLMQQQPFEITPADTWSDDRWATEQENRNFEKNEGNWSINEGEAEGTIIGANLCTFNLLQGTNYMPPMKNTILFLEDNYETRAEIFDRDLQSVLHQKDFSEVKGLIIGRFQKESEINRDILTKIIKTKKELKNIPIIANVDFGHTTPLFTFPIGGSCHMVVEKNKSKIEIIRH